MTAPLIRSATKRQFLIQLGLDPHDDRTSQTYWLLKVSLYGAQGRLQTDQTRMKLSEHMKPNSRVGVICCGQSTPTKTHHTRRRTSLQQHSAMSSG